MVWQLVPVLALAGFGFCVIWARVLTALARPVQSLWKCLFDADLRRLPPLLGEPTYFIRDGEHLPIHGLLAYERELAKVVSRPPQSVSGIILYADPPEQGCDVPQERRVEVLRSGTFGNRPPYPTRIQTVFDDACLHTGYEVPDPRRTA